MPARPAVLVLAHGELHHRHMRLLLFEQVAHFDRESPGEAHAEVVAHGAHVGVGGVVEEVDRCGEHGGVFAVKHLRGAPFVDELDETLVLPRVHQEHIQGECPQNAVGRRGAVDDLAPRVLIVFQLTQALVAPLPRHLREGLTEIERNQPVGKPFVSSPLTN